MKCSALRHPPSPPQAPVSEGFEAPRGYRGDRRIGIYPANEFYVSCYVDFPHPLVGKQEFEMVVNEESSASCWLVPVLFASSANSAASSYGLDSRRLARKRHCLNRRRVMNGPLRFPDEFSRHKALDLIGDLALVGLPLLARVEAHKLGTPAYPAGQPPPRRPLPLDHHYRRSLRPRARNSRTVSRKGFPPPISNA